MNVLEQENRRMTISSQTIIQYSKSIIPDSQLETLNMHLTSTLLETPPCALYSLAPLYETPTLYLHLVPLLDTPQFYVTLLETIILYFHLLAVLLETPTLYVLYSVGGLI